MEHGKIESKENVQLEGSLTGAAGANASTPADIKDAVDKKHSQNTDIVLNSLTESLYISQTKQEAGVPIYGDICLAQSFAPMATGFLNKVAFQLFKVNSPSDLVVELQGAVAGKPDGNVLAFQVVPSSIITSDLHEQEIIFSKPYHIIEGNNYTLVLKNSGGDVNNNYKISVKWDTNPFPMGNASLSEDGGNSWMAWFSDDLYFKVYLGLLLPLIDDGEIKKDLSIAAGKKIGTKTIEEYQDAVDKKHSRDINRYLEDFVNADLVTGILTVNHTLAEKYVEVQVYDNNDKLISSDDVTLTDADNLDIDLTSYGAISGTWHCIIKR